MIIFLLENGRIVDEFEAAMRASDFLTRRLFSLIFSCRTDRPGYDPTRNGAGSLSLK
jgi:hypothetical protein